MLDLFLIVSVTALTWCAFTIERPVRRTRNCRDCYGAMFPVGAIGGRCLVCAHEHTEAIARYGEFCQLWRQVGIETYLRSSRHQTGVYR